MLGTPQSRLAGAQFPLAPEPLAIDLGVDFDAAARRAFVHIPRLVTTLAQLLLTFATHGHGLMRHVEERRGTNDAIHFFQDDTR